MTRPYRYIDKSAAFLKEEEIKENRKRLEERERIHLRYGMDRASAYSHIAGLLLPLQSKVLEIGTGRGVTAAFLAKSQGSITTVDVSDSDTRTALLNAAHDKTLDRISYCVCDAVSLPFLEKEFDHSVSINGFHHFSNPKAVMAEMLRVTKNKIVVADFSESGFEIIRAIHAMDGNTHEEHNNDTGLIGRIFRELGYEPERHDTPNFVVYVVDKKKGRS
ncbi:MAG: class I SAM-dependent methyltransferase [Candidatus Margulisiibacteriota bacterium]